MSGPGTPATSAAVRNPQLWNELAPTADRQDLLAAARAHLGDRFPLSGLRGRFDDESCADPERVDPAWAEIVDNGYPTIGVDAEWGGLGSRADLVALLETAGGLLLPTPLLAAAGAWQTLLHVGLGEHIHGDLPAALGVLVAADGEAPDRILALDGVAASTLVVVRAEPGQALLARIDPAELGPPRVHRQVDPGRPLAEYLLPDRTGAAAMRWVGVPDVTSADAVLAAARMCVAADLTGVAAAALQRAVEHACDREQFGRKIGTFQGVKHKLADVYVAVERARSLTRATAVLLDNGEPPTDTALLAKGAAADAAAAATRAYVQVLGAMGMTFESDAHLYFRRAQQTLPFLGSAAECYRTAAVHRRAAR